MRSNIVLILTLMMATSACATAIDTSERQDVAVATSPERREAIDLCVGAIQASQAACPSVVDLPRNEPGQLADCGEKLGILTSACLAQAQDWYRCGQETRYQCTIGSAVPLDCDAEHAAFVICIQAHNQFDEP